MQALHITQKVMKILQSTTKAPTHQHLDLINQAIEAEVQRRIALRSQVYGEHVEAFRQANLHRMDLPSFDESNIPGAERVR